MRHGKELQGYSTELGRLCKEESMVGWLCVCVCTYASISHSSFYLLLHLHFIFTSSYVLILIHVHSVRNGGEIRECMKVENMYIASMEHGSAGANASVNNVNSSTEPIEDCQELRSAYYLCKRGGLDMRTRIRGQRVY